MKKVYIAYGSNMPTRHMKCRCPEARFMGTGVVQNWELVFSECADIRPSADNFVPVVIWEIDERDEYRLDIYEGYPNFYKKIDLEFTWITDAEGNSFEGTGKGMVYVMNGERPIMGPSQSYYEVIEEGYMEFDLPMVVLARASQKSFKTL